MNAEYCSALASSVSSWAFFAAGRDDCSRRLSEPYEFWRGVEGSAARGAIDALGTRPRASARAAACSSTGALVGAACGGAAGRAGAEVPWPRARRGPDLPTPTFPRSRTHLLVLGALGQQLVHALLLEVLHRLLLAVLAHGVAARARGRRLVGLGHADDDGGLSCLDSRSKPTSKRSKRVERAKAGEASKAAAGSTPRPRRSWRRRGKALRTHRSHFGPARARPRAGRATPTRRRTSRSPPIVARKTRNTPNEASGDSSRRGGVVKNVNDRTLHCQNSMCCQCAPVRR